MTSLAPSPSSAPQGGGPLAGVRVLDFSHILAGPYCTRILADLGADVAKVESHSRPDATGAVRLPPEYTGRRDRSTSFLNTNRNKRSITINLKSDGGKALAARLASVADVLVENFSARVMDRLDLGYRHLQPVNPRLIYVSMSGYGHNGPRRDWTSMNSNLQAYTGLMMVNGTEEDEPISISNSWNDYMGGLHATVGILQALARRAKTGVGMNLDLAQFECSVATVGPLLLASAVNGEAPTRLGNRSTSVAPQGCYRCAGRDEWCVISVQTDEQWRALLDVMEANGRFREPDFATVLGRLARHDEIDRAIESWTSELAKEEVERRLRAAGVPAERMRRRGARDGRRRARVRRGRGPAGPPHPRNRATPGVRRELHHAHCAGSARWRAHRRCASRLAGTRRRGDRTPGCR